MRAIADIGVQDSGLIGFHSQLEGLRNLADLTFAIVILGNMIDSLQIVKEMADAIEVLQDTISMTPGKQKK